MRMVIIAVVALLLLGGIGAGAYFYFNQQAQASSGGEVGKAAEAAKEAAAKDEEKAKAAEKLEYVQLDPLILPIVDNDGFTQVVSLVVALEVDSVDKKDHVKKLQPRITDAFIQAMYGELSQEAALKGGVVNVATVKQQLNQIVEKVMGKGVVNQVLLQVVQQRPS